jgi:hypothetical protein
MKGKLTRIPPMLCSLKCTNVSEEPAVSIKVDELHLPDYAASQSVQQPPA